MSDAQTQAKGAPTVRVLIVDDSAVTREVLTALLDSDPDIRVIGKASTGAEAVELTATLRPDLVMMDLMMPGMDGMEATRRIMARHPTPVLFLSSFFDKEGSYSRTDAIAAGALDVVEKPALMPDWRWHNAAGKLVQKVKSLSKVPVIAHIHGARKLLAQDESQLGAFVGPAADAVAIGGSSGGPRVIEALLSSLPSTYALGIVIVQHMTDGFTATMLRWLQERCPLQIKVAEEGDAIVPRRVLFTPEGSHLVVGIGGRVHLSDGPPVNGHRPSIDVTFQSVAKVYGARSAGVLLTGMGSDGARGLLSIRQAGGVTLAQDEESSQMFGMPRAAIELRAVQQVLPPAGIIRSLNALHVERVRSLI
jgi:two-component system, chemotaxis family, protein-glutamate methylesterase/glutaminase